MIQGREPELARVAVPDRVVRLEVVAPDRVVHPEVVVRDRAARRVVARAQERPPDAKLESEGIFGAGPPVKFVPVRFTLGPIRTHRAARLRWVPPFPSDARALEAGESGVSLSGIS